MKTNTPNLPPLPVIELRQYTLHPGARQCLVELFEREFIHSQNAVGLHVLATFLDAADPDRFVWLRGFAGMAQRRRGLEAFYGGPVWQAHRDEANATMIDSDDVLLLRPLNAWPAGAATGRWHALVCPLTAPADDTLRTHLRDRPGIWLETESAANDFPRLPVRRGSWLVGLAPQPPELDAELQAQLAAPARRLELIPTAQSPLR